MPLCETEDTSLRLLCGFRAKGTGAFRAFATPSGGGVSQSGVLPGGGVGGGIWPGWPFIGTGIGAGVDTAEDHLASRSLVDRGDQDVYGFVDEAASAIDDDHGAVLQISDTLSRFLAFA